MKRFLGLGVLMVLGSVGGVLFYFWQQATQLPQWYVNAAPPSVTGETQLQGGSQSQMQQQRQTLETKIADRVDRAIESGQPADLQLDSKEVNSLLTSELTRTATAKLGRAVKGVNTTIKDGKVESGAVVNLAEVPLDRLSAAERSTVTKMITAFPNLNQRTIYIGVEGQPIVRDGQVKLDSNTRLRLGDLSFTPAEIAQRLGVSEEKVRQQLELQLQLGKLKVSDIELVGDRAVIRGTPSPN
jgi:hypothetical protein